MKIEKVFVYEGDYTSPYCVQDAATFFTAQGVFGKPDLCRTDFSSDNFSGLDPSKIALVIPGGSALFMSQNLSKIPIIPALLKAGVHYIGFCAGAYLALNALIYRASHQVINGVLDLPQQALAEGDTFSFGLSQHYAAVGPFYPDFNYYVDWQKQYHAAYTPNQFRDANKPYAIDLTFNGSRDQSLSALYVAGCAFTSREIVKNEMHVLASYPKQSYRFLNFVTPYGAHVEEKIETLGAIIARRPDPEKNRGGIFLTGPHLEASVQDSSMIRFFSTRSKDGRIVLDDEKIAVLKNNREALQAEAVRLVNGAFGCH